MIGRGKTTAIDNLRKIPNGEVICELPKGTCFDVISVKTTATIEWLFVSVDRTGKIGYVASKFTEWKRNVPRPGPAEWRPSPPFIPLPNVVEPSRPAVWMPIAVVIGAAIAVLCLILGLKHL